MSGLSSKTQNFNKVESGVEFSVSAPGKVILHGEHSVVYGKLAVAASLGLRTKIHLVEIDCLNRLILKILPLDFEHDFDLMEVQKQLLVESTFINGENSDFNWESPRLVNHPAQVEIVEKVVKAFLHNRNDPVNVTALKAVINIFYLLFGILSSTRITLTSMCITIDSELSMGAGTGSSASFSVALSALFIRYLKLKTLELENISKKNYKSFKWDKRDIEGDRSFSARELEAISDWAFCGEKIFHGTPSGLDNTVCTYGQLVKFRKNHSTTHLTLASSLKLLLVNTNVPRETLKMVNHVATLKATFSHIVEHVMDALEDLTVSALDVVKKIDNSQGDNKDYIEKCFDEWKTLIQMNHSLLSALGVSHQKLEEVIMILRQNGLTGKLTGAGGGGFAISIIPPAYDPEEVVRILKEHGFGVIVTQLGGGGVRVD